MGAIAAGFWGFVAGVSLLIGLYAGPSRRVVAIVMALGAGVLVFFVAFELMDEATGAVDSMRFPWGCFAACSPSLAPIGW